MILQPSDYDAAQALLVSELVALRQRAGISQRELGRRIELPQTVIQRIEHGQRRVDYIELLIICAACGESSTVFFRNFLEKYRAQK